LQMLPQHQPAEMARINSSSPTGTNSSLLAQRRELTRLLEGDVEPTPKPPRPGPRSETDSPRKAYGQSIRLVIHHPLWSATFVQRSSFNPNLTYEQTQLRESLLQSTGLAEISVCRRLCCHISGPGVDVGQPVENAGAAQHGRGGGQPR